MAQELPKSDFKTFQFHTPPHLELGHLDLFPVNKNMFLLLIPTEKIMLLLASVSELNYSKGGPRIPAWPRHFSRQLFSPFPCLFSVPHV